MSRKAYARTQAVVPRSIHIEAINGAKNTLQPIISMVSSASIPAIKTLMRRTSNASLKQFRALIAVSSRGSFTAASEDMHICQSALSALIRSLEQEMGVKLVDRTTRRVELTIAGAEVVATIGRLIDEIDRMTNDMRDVASGRRGRVRLGATPLLASTSLPSIIASFSERNPGVETSLFDATADALLAKLRAGELDLVIATYEGIATDIEAQVLFSDSMMLVCAATHPQSGLVSLPWRSLQNERLVQLAVGSGLRALTDRTLREIGISIAPTQEVTQVSTALALVEAGLGVAVLPSHAISTLNAAQLKALPLVEPVVLRDVSLLRHQQRSMSPAASAMHHYLMAQRHRMATYLDGKP